MEELNNIDSAFENKVEPVPSMPVAVEEVNKFENTQAFEETIIKESYEKVNDFENESIFETVVPEETVEFAEETPAGNIDEFAAFAESIDGERLEAEPDDEEEEPVNIYDIFGTSQPVAEEINTPAEEVTEVAEEVVEDTVETAEEVAEDTAEETVDTVEEVAEETTEEAVAAGEAAEEVVEETAEEAVANVEEAAEETVEETTETVEEAAETEEIIKESTEAVEEDSNTAEEVVETAKSEDKRETSGRFVSPIALASEFGNSEEKESEESTDSISLPGGGRSVFSRRTRNANNRTPERWQRNDKPATKFGKTYNFVNDIDETERLVTREQAKGGDTESLGVSFNRVEKFKTDDVVDSTNPHERVIMKENNSDSPRTELRVTSRFKNEERPEEIEKERLNCPIFADKDEDDELSKILAIPIEKPGKKMPEFVPGKNKKGDIEEVIVDENKEAVNEETETVTEDVAIETLETVKEEVVAEQVAETAEENVSEENIEESVKEIAEEPKEESVVEASENAEEANEEVSFEEPVTETIEDVKEETSEEPVEEINEEAVEENIENSVEEAVFEEPVEVAEETAEETAEEVAFEEPAAEIIEDTAEAAEEAAFEEPVEV
ncbi:MAG: hypothetical protein II598_02775, partial [Elusimicrobia bacterium]|nr:hypothetical protein [Elusimicrobiota bacterium]